MFGLINSLISFSVVSRSPFLKCILWNFYNLEHNHVLLRHLPCLHVSKLFFFLVSVKLCVSRTNCTLLPEKSQSFFLHFNGVLKFSYYPYIYLCVCVYYCRTITCLTNQTQVWFKFASTKGHQNVRKKTIIQFLFSLELMHTQKQFKYNTKFARIHNIGVYYAYTEIYLETNLKWLTMSWQQSFFILVTHF